MSNVLTFVYAFMFIQIFMVAINDVKYRKISNQWMILNMTLFVALLFIAPEHYQLTTETFFYSLTFLLVGFVGFFLKIMGPGDSKYLFSLFLVTPLVWHNSFFSVLLYSTCIIGGFSILTQLAQNYEKIADYAKVGYSKGIRECMGSKFPYAPVILMSWAWMGHHLYF